MNIQEVLDSHTDWELAAFVSRLNHWEWPEVFGPCPFGANALMQEAHDCIHPVTEAILAKISRKTWSHYHFLVTMKKTEEEFETFWTEQEKETLEQKESKRMVLKQILGSSNKKCEMRINDVIPIPVLHTPPNTVQ
jgi:hypothetical protein